MTNDKRRAAVAGKLRPIVNDEAMNGLWLEVQRYIESCCIEISGTGLHEAFAHELLHKFDDVVEFVSVPAPGTTKHVIGFRVRRSFKLAFAEAAKHGLNRHDGKLQIDRVTIN